jgi:hypothetical protein
MAWPPVVPPADATNTTALHDTHPSYHNQMATALNDVVTKINAGGTVGPPGPPGPTAVSADAGNAVKLGTDSLTYSKQLAYVVAKTTQPTAADYGLGAIPVGAVWVQTP